MKKINRLQSSSFYFNVSCTVTRELKAKTKHSKTRAKYTDKMGNQILHHLKIAQYEKKSPEATLFTLRFFLLLQKIKFFFRVGQLRGDAGFDFS